MFYNLNQFQSKNIEYICKLDVKNLQKACVEWISTTLSNYANNINYYNVGMNAFVSYDPRESKVRYSFTNEIYNYLFKQNLHIYLGINADYFKCFMHRHNDQHASIYLKDDDTWIYKCFDPECKFKIGDINKITECLTGLNRPKALEFLMQVYGIVLEKNEWQIEQEKILDANIELLLDIENLKNNYPELYKRIQNYIPQLIILHEYAKRNITIEQIFNNDLVTFKAPVRDISQALIAQGKSGDIKTISKRNNILIFIGLLKKLSDDMILPSELEKIKEYALSQNFINYYNYYVLPSYSYNVLTDAENKSIEFKNSGITVQGFSFEMLKRGFTNNELIEVYPRQKNNDTNTLNDEIIEIIKKKIYKDIKEKGYCIEKDIYSNGYFIRNVKNKLKIKDSKKINKKTVEYIFKLCLSELINTYEFKRSRINKKLRDRFELDNIKGSPNIIYLDKENENVDN